MNVELHTAADPTRTRVNCMLQFGNARVIPNPCDPLSSSRSIFRV